jgi:hypothetical protein
VEHFCLPLPIFRTLDQPLVVLVPVVVTLEVLVLEVRWGKWRCSK